MKDSKIEELNQYPHMYTNWKHEDVLDDRLTLSIDKLNTVIRKLNEQEDWNRVSEFISKKQTEAINELNGLESQPEEHVEVSGATNHVPDAYIDEIKKGGPFKDPSPKSQPKEHRKWCKVGWDIETHWHDCNCKDPSPKKERICHACGSCLHN